MNFIDKLLFIITILLPVLVFGQNRWEVTYGIPNDDNYLFSKAIDYDRGILLNWIADDNGKKNLSKMDVNGTEIWQKLVFNDGNIIQLEVLLSNNQQTVIGGSTKGFPFLTSLNKCYQTNWCSNFINNQLFHHGHFVDAIILDNGDILAMAYLEPPDIGLNKTDRIYLFYYDNMGNLLWYNLYASGTAYPLMEYPIPMYLTKFDNYYIISGFCYYPYPDNPDLLVLRPMFIRIDTEFDEQWMLPYGVEDSVVGMASGVIEKSQTGENIGVGRYAGIIGTFSVTPLMHFDSLGNETSIFLILNDSIGPNIQANSAIDIIALGDTNYILSSFFGTYPYGNPVGELLLDTSYRVINSLSHPYTDINSTRIESLLDNSFSFGVNIYENPPENYNRDILLYKLNADLSQAEFDTSTIVYDSLCDSLPIVSDTIYLNNCSIITGIDEIPTPQEYYSFIKTIPVDVFPNPATSDIVFELGNTGLHKNIRLSCFDINGKLVFEQSVQPAQTKLKSSVENWQSGMYIAVTSSSTGGAGSVKFVVK
ncbi:MAG: hypothetical protein DRJ10_00295 [Bacteroidetes bacterium]|nr:MAG: hypothetical protein DRJ10_00295 [Bacteroidota bacterium]